MRLLDIQAKLTAVCLGSLWNCGTCSSSLALSGNNHEKMFLSSVHTVCATKVDLTDIAEMERDGLYSPQISPFVFPTVIMSALKMLAKLIQNGCKTLITANQIEQ